MADAPTTKSKKEKKAAGQGCDIKRHNCPNDGQDRLHGSNMRVMNRMANGDFRCTVCGKELSKG